MAQNKIRYEAFRWDTNGYADLYVIQLGPNMFEWHMISKTTGTHSIQCEGDNGRPYPDERVMLHWNGFKDNQKKL